MYVLSAISVGVIACAMLASQPGTGLPVSDSEAAQITGGCEYANNIDTCGGSGLCNDEIATLGTTFHGDSMQIVPCGNHPDCSGCYSCESLIFGCSN